MRELIRRPTDRPVVGRSVGRSDGRTDGQSVGRSVSRSVARACPTTNWRPLDSTDLCCDWLHAPTCADTKRGDKTGENMKRTSRQPNTTPAHRRRATGARTRHPTHGMRRDHRRTQSSAKELGSKAQWFVEPVYERERKMNKRARSGRWAVLRSTVRHVGHL